jgi:sulfate permease, SulP family
MRRLLPEVRFDRHELAGGLGDAGLFIPIAVALITINGLNATAVFVAAGLAYVSTALYFGVPVSVQPLKAFAAAAIALKLDAEVIAAGALLMAVAMAFLASTNLAGWLADRFPLVLVRGIQASVALLLASAAMKLAETGNWSELPHVSGTIGVLTMLGACLALFLLARRRVPGSLLVLGGGAAAGVAVAGGLPDLSFGPQSVGLSLPDGPAFGTALTSLVLAQIPLTFGNSVVATADAERVYFGARARRVRPRRLAGSIAAANTVAGLTSALPMCHGAGGVTAHVKLGARTAGATILVGAIYAGLGLALGGSLPALLRLLLPGALAGMLLYVALQHAVLASQLETASDRVLAAGVGAVTILSGNLGIGFAAGVTALSARALWRNRRLGQPEGATS